MLKASQTYHPISKDEDLTVQRNFLKKISKVSIMQALLCAGTVMVSANANAGIFSSKTPTTSPIAVDTQSAGTPDFVPLVKAVKPAVVSITAKIKEKESEEDGAGSMQGRGQIPGMPFGFPFPFMMPGPQMGPVEAKGSGFLISSDGYIVTNNHVVTDATRVSVKLSDGTSLNAKVVGHDPKTDLAVLKVTATKALPYLDLGNSEEVQPGQWIVAVGDPYGLGGTVTAGIVSALGRDLHSGAYNDFIQIDAPINRGNSGGPLLTLSGKVVGVNSMILSPGGGGSIGIGFAIPSDTVRSVVDQLRKNGHVVRGYLGILGQNITPTLAQALGLPSPANGTPARGALVASVVAGGPASKAGVKVGDVILTVNGNHVRSGHDLAVKVTAIKPGSTATLGILRSGKAMNIPFTVGDLSSHSEDKTPVTSKAGQPGKLGISLAPLTPQVRRELGLDDTIQGAAVSEVRPDSPAASAGIQPGDVITAVGQQSTPTPRSAVALINKALVSKRPVLLRVLREGQQVFIAVSLDASQPLDDGSDD